MNRIVKKIIVEGEFGKPPRKRTEINYSTMSSEELLLRIRQYEAKYGSYEEFSKSVDCGDSTFEILVEQDDWHNLIEERRRRVLEGEIKIILNSKPTTFQELMQTTRNSQKSLYEILTEMERKKLIKKYVVK